MGGSIRNTQIIDNNLTGTSINRNYKFYDEREIPLSEGEIRWWQGKYWKVIKDITLADVGGTMPKEEDLTNTPDLQPDFWFPLPNYAEQRFVFETMIIQSSVIDATELNDKIFTNFAVRMKGNFNSYNNFLFDFEGLNNGKNIYGVQFADIAEFVSWYNAKNFAYGTTVTVYANINLGAVPIHKLYGLNNAFSIIKGKNIQGQSNYLKSGSGYMSDWEHIDDFSNDILTRITGVAPSSTSDSKRAIHFNGNKKNMYVLYNTTHFNNTIRFEAVSSQKRSFNPHTNSFSSISSQQEFFPIDGANAFYYVNNDTSSWAFYGVQNIIDSEYFSSSKSLVKVYAFKDVNDNFIAIVKPVGQDLFTLNWVGDMTNLNIYAGYYNRDDKMRIEKLNSDDYAYRNNDYANISLWIKKSALLKSQSCNLTNNINKNTIRNVVFFFCDNEGNMTTLSHEIDWVIKGSGAKVYAMLNNSHRYG